MSRKGNCYYTSEAIYHLIGGKKAGWTPQYMNTRETGKHWFLKHKSGMIIDATVKQFQGLKPNYEKSKGCGFLTKQASKHAAILMDKMVWHDPNINDSRNA